MAAVVVLGDRHRIQALAIAGAHACAAVTPDEVIDAWDRLANDVAVLVLTRAAAATLGHRVDERRDLLVTVLT